MERVLAAVRVAPGTTEIRDFPMPDIPEDSALLKMEVAGICGTDVKLYQHPPSDAPVIMGHENIGLIAKAGVEFTRRKGFKEGDLVFVEHYVMCGKCEWCHIGQYRHCENTDWRHNPDAIRYGYTSAEKAPHLWGGFAQYVYLPWNSVVHHVPKGVTPELAGLVTPMANGVEWSLFDGGVGYNTSVLIQGPGQQGLSQTVIAKQAGAALIIVTGTSKDGARPAGGKASGRRLRHRCSKGTSAGSNHGHHKRPWCGSRPGLHIRCRNDADTIGCRRAETQRRDNRCSR
jgi:threonine dehydrogenase-like Zn-dependent dehydrogenase